MSKSWNTIETLVKQWFIKNSFVVYGDAMDAWRNMPFENKGSYIGSIDEQSMFSSCVSWLVSHHGPQSAVDINQIVFPSTPDYNTELNDNENLDLPPKKAKVSKKKLSVSEKDNVSNNENIVVDIFDDNDSSLSTDTTVPQQINKKFRRRR